MPSSSTITSFYNFTALTTIRSSEVNTNFSAFRGHLLPVDPNTSTAAATMTYDMGSIDHMWRANYSQYGIMYANTASSVPTVATSTTYALYFKNDGNLYKKNSSGTETQIDQAASSASSSYELTNLGLATSVSSNALTIALKQADGSSDPASGAGAVKVGMRSSTLTSGLYNQRSVTSSLSLVISSGSTLGQISTLSARLFIYLIDNSGTLELAVSQKLFDESQLVSTTAEGGAGGADSAIVMYSTTARSNVPFRVIGFLDNTQTTAGTWTSAGTKLQVGDYAIINSERVAFVANGASSTSIGTNTTIPFNTPDEDTHSGWSSANKDYVVQISGTYKVNSQIRVSSGGATVNQYIDCIIQIDGVSKREFAKYVENTGVSGWSAGTSWQGYLTAGQKIRTVGDTSIGTPSLTTGATHTYMEIFRVK